MNPNQTVRLFAAMSLVEQGDATIDEYQALTIDKARFDGHFYCDKAPGMTLLALPAVALADPIGGRWRGPLPQTVFDPTFERFLRLRLILAVASITAVLTALAAAALHDLALRLAGDPIAALVASLGFALGTPIWGWSTTLFGHAPVAALLVIAVWALWRAGEARRLGLAALAGGALGLSALIELQSVLAGSVIALWGIWRLRAVRPLAAAAIAGAVVLLVPLVAYNLVAFGTPFRLGYQGVVGFDGMNQGLFGLALPDARVLVEIVAGKRRGLLWVAPVLVLAPAGLWQLARRQRATALMLAGAIAAILLVNAAYVYWDGGNSTGPRHSVAALGLLAVGLAPFWAGLRRMWERVVVGVLLALSIAINLAIAAADTLAPADAAFPLWDPILAVDWRGGILRTLPSDWLGWSPFAGVSLYLALAAPLALVLAITARAAARSAPSAP